MTAAPDLPQRGIVPASTTLTAQQLKGAIDDGRTGDKLASDDLAAVPLGTDDEAAGTPDTPYRVATALRQELEMGSHIGQSNHGSPQIGLPATRRPRPRSPNIQIYRPQLTSVLSILNRFTGVVLSAGAVVLVGWLVAGASGSQAFGLIQAYLASWWGNIMLAGVTFAFFFHLCGGIRHLVWDTVHGFSLRSIYISGWAVVAASTVLTLAAWFLSLSMKG
jgi:succinate dehydrogenase / fumarate reductase cytochrome b subunit